MKRLLLLITALFFGLGAQGQIIIEYNDTNTGYLIPNFDPSALHYIAWNCSGIGPYQMTNFRRGTYYPTESEGTKIFGVACMLFDCVDTVPDYYVYLFRDDNGCTPIDSVRIDTVRPTTYIRMDDTLLPLFEVFFSRGYEIDSFRYSICLSRAYYPPEGESYRPMVYFREFSNYAGTYGWGSFTQNRDGYCRVEEYGVYITCAFPIIDSTLRLLHEMAGTCGDIGKITAEYKEPRVFSLHWSDTNEHCLYQMAYGRANQSPSTYTVLETADTSHPFISTVFGEQYAFRVRAKCCLNDSLSLWRPWSDTVRFARPYYTITLTANNHNWGSVEGGGKHEQNAPASIGAYPAEHCTFVGWNDGDTTNPRNFTLVCDTAFTAIFEYHEDTTHGGTSVVTTDNTKEITLAPNPTDGVIHITASNAMMSVEVYDQLGRKVISRKADGNGAEIDLGDLPSGVYTVGVLTDSGITVRKIIRR